MDIAIWARRKAILTDEVCRFDCFSDSTNCSLVFSPDVSGFKRNLFSIVDSCRVICSQKL